LEAIKNNIEIDNRWKLQSLSIQQVSENETNIIVVVEDELKVCLFNQGQRRNFDCFSHVFFLMF